MTPAHLEAEILKLPRSIRARLAEILISSLDEETEIEKAWVEEADRRYQAHLSREEEAVSVENAIYEIRKELGL
ncbi:MAG: addiction module protein [Rhodothermia bacterium]